MLGHGEIFRVVYLDCTPFASLGEYDGMRKTAGAVYVSWLCARQGEIIILQTFGFWVSNKSIAIISGRSGTVELEWTEVLSLLRRKTTVFPKSYKCVFHHHAMHIYIGFVSCNKPENEKIISPSARERENEKRKERDCI